jgi:hypothetical protein
MSNYKRRFGLGDITYNPADYDEIDNELASGLENADATAKPSFWDTFTNITSNLTNLATGVTSTVNAIKSNPSGGGVVYSNALPNQPAGNNNNPNSTNTMKYLLIGGGGLAAVGIGYAIYQSGKKKKKSLNGPKKKK